MVRDIIFNNRNLQSFGLYLVGNTFETDFPNRGAQTTTVRGQINGDIITDKGGYTNIERTYRFKTIPSKIPYESEEQFVKSFTDWSSPNRGAYGKLFDTKRNGYFCEAFIKEISDLVRYYKRCFEVSITFSCRPYWYRVEGFNSIEQSTSSDLTFTINNPEAYTAYPYFKISTDSADRNTTGFSLTVNSDTLTASATGAYLEIDSEKMNVFRGNSPKNYLIQGTKFPKLKPGLNTITFEPGNSDTWTLELIPRWRCL